MIGEGTLRAKRVAEPASNSRERVRERTKLSDKSVAVKIADPEAVDFTLKVVWPLLSDTEFKAVIVSEDPRFELRSTNLLAIGLPQLESKVTVMVE